MPLFWKSLRDSRTGMLGVLIVLLVVLVAVFAPVLAPYAPGKQDLMHKLADPAFAGGLRIICSARISSDATSSRG